MARTNWTASLIEEQAEGIAVSLGYFPSNGDLCSMGRGDLSGAIQKFGGFCHWSKRLGISPRLLSAKWTNEEIEKQLRNASDTLGHFPSVSNLKEMGLSRLESAIGKRGGIIAWAARLGLEREHSDSDTGWDGENDIKTMFELQGFIVEDRKNIKAPYDLLINDRVRCDVKTASQATYNLANGKPWSAWYYRIGKFVQSDIVVLYRADLKDCFVLPWFEVGTTNITISPNSPKYSKFKDRFDIITSFETAIKSIKY